MALVPSRPGSPRRWFSTSMLSSPLLSSPQAAAGGTAGGAAIFGTPTAATVGVPYLWVPSTSGLTAPLVFAQTAGTPPTGTAFDVASGGFPGTPTTPETKAGISIQVTDSASPTPHILTLSGLSIVVSAALTLTNSPATTIGLGASYNFTPTTSGGRAPITWVQSSKPSWLNFSSSTGALTGTSPGAPETDTGISVTGTDADGRVVSTGTFQIAVTNAAPAPFAQVNVIFVGDSVTAGRGSGGGTLGMDGARALSFPTIVANRLNALGITASSQTIGQAGNTLSDEGGLIWENYDPRVVHNTWGSGASTAGGAITQTASAGVDFAFTPNVSIDTFDIWVAVTVGGTGQHSLSIDAGAATVFKDTTTTLLPGLSGALRMQKLTFPSGALGGHTLHTQRASGTAGFLTMVGYTAATPDVRIFNMGIRGITTVSYATGTNPYDLLPSLANYAAPNGVSIICLGINDITAGGSTLAAYTTALQTIVTQQLPFGEVILMVPTPIAPGSAIMFTQAQMKTAVQSVATASGNLTVIDSPTILASINGSSPSVWDALNAVGQTYDSLHLTANPYLVLGNSLGDTIAAKVWAASTPPANNTTFLCVGGGGGGGNGFGPGGGGGAGGLVTGTFIAKSGTYTITVGGGGAGGASGAASHQGAVGTDSSIVFSGGTLTTGLGGGGGASGVGNGQGGGSGGGASVTGLSGVGNFGQGFSGGVSGAALGSGGGGGAGAAGTLGTAGVGGNGGAGLNNSITGAAVGYAGGGGAGGTASGTGTHGGGNGGASATAGAANTGGGGGGALTSAVAGANGGTGVVILRVLTSAFTPTTTGSPTITTDGLYSVYKYTASGTFVVP